MNLSMPALNHLHQMIHANKKFVELVGFQNRPVHLKNISRKSIFLLILILAIQSCANERTWQEVAVPYDSGCLGNVIWTGKQFAVLAEYGDEYHYRRLLTSTDGINWTRNEIALSTIVASRVYTVIELKWYNNQYFFIAPGDNIAFSTNGINWFQLPVSAVTKGFNDITWDGTQYIAVGDSGTISTSKDLINWTSHRISDPNFQFKKIYYLNDMYIARGSYNAGIFYSNDGLKWSRIDIFGLNDYFITFTKDQFIAYGYNSVLTSTDAKKWTSRMILGPNLQYLTWGFDDYVALSDVRNGALEIWSSKDLSIWRQYEYKPPYDLGDSLWGYQRTFRCVAHNGERYVITGYESHDSTCAGGFILTSQ